uniref:Uncharacterized protein n=1 Tax=Peronospora matthiolae TaxID=2874970 RepID=A0AAV1TT66_9STRA
MGVHLPIEIPHCGDLKDSTTRTILEQEEVGVLHFYDVCELASETVSVQDASVKVFCESLSNCYESFRSFDIKILAVILSRFEEVMLLDAESHVALRYGQVPEYRHAILLRSFYRRKNTLGKTSPSSQ